MNYLIQYPFSAVLYLMIFVEDHNLTQIFDMRINMLF